MVLLPEAARCDPAFLPLLKDFGLADAEDHGGTVVGLWPDLTIAYVNRAWRTFAVENGTANAAWLDEPRGRSLLYEITPGLWHFFREHFARCLSERRPWEHQYECSSPELKRKFHMKVYPLGAAEGLLAVHSLVFESPHTESGLPPIDGRYRTRDGQVVQCCHCRRVRRADQEETWDWVPLWVKQAPPRTSHGFCPPCFRYYYHESRLQNPEFPETFTTGRETSRDKNDWSPG